MNPMEYIVNRSWAEIDLDALASNCRYLTALASPQTEIMGVVKADGYGHGAYEVAKCMLDNGYTRLAVSMLDEAIQLRQQGIEAPILVLSYTDPRRAGEIIQHQITQTVYSWDLIDALEVAAKSLDLRPKVHIKIDTGMSRIGFLPEFDSIEHIEHILRLKHVQVEGIYTHFATADEQDSTYVDQQFRLFHSIYTELERQGLYIPIKHCCNSAAFMRYPAYHLNLVRVGLATYGLLPDECDQHAPYLKPVMALKSMVIDVKTVEENTGVGYGRRYIAPSARQIATIPIGYADGYARIMSGKAQVMIRGCLAPVVGNICMDACMVDVTDLPTGVQLGDEVILFGFDHLPNGDEVCLPVSELAKWQQTIAYEVVCIVGKRVPRVYLSHGKIQRIHSDIF